MTASTSTELFDFKLIANSAYQISARGQFCINLTGCAASTGWPPARSPHAQRRTHDCPAAPTVFDGPPPMAEPVGTGFLRTLAGTVSQRGECRKSMLSPPLQSEENTITFLRMCPYHFAVIRQFDLFESSSCSKHFSNLPSYETIFPHPLYDLAFCPCACACCSTY